MKHVFFGSIVLILLSFWTYSLCAAEKAETNNRARFLELFSTHTESLDPKRVMANPPTPTQPEGPFYPDSFPDETDQDLTRLGDKTQATGVVVHLRGHVLDNNNMPIAGAKIEIWQACHTGKYNHPNDPNKASIDPNFQYYGNIFTHQNGNYSFKTIVPGPYPANSTWWRPPHIHFMISKHGYKNLITQSYFNGEYFPDPITEINKIKITGEIINNYNQQDLILKQLSNQDKKRLIVDFPKDNNNNKTGVFDIILEEI